MGQLCFLARFRSLGTGGGSVDDLYHVEDLRSWSNVHVQLRLVALGEMDAAVLASAERMDGQRLAAGDSTLLEKLGIQGQARQEQVWAALCRGNGAAGASPGLLGWIERWTDEVIGCLLIDEKTS